MCHCLSVSRSSFYSWLASPTSNRAKEDLLFIEKIKEIFKDSLQTYGTRRIKLALAKLGYKISRRRICRLMKNASLSCRAKRKFKATTDSNHNLPVAENLLNRRFTVTKANTHYVGDITYIQTQEGWLYLAVVIDLFSRKVVGYAMENNMRAELVNRALLNAIWHRNPPAGLVWHTDRGSQYASTSHRKILSMFNIQQSMSSRANCWDNAVSESFFHTLKVELVHNIAFKSREAAKLAIFEYIEAFYNKKRMHSANDYLSPDEFELVQNM